MFDYKLNFPTYNIDRYLETTSAPNEPLAKLAVDLKFLTAAQTKFNKNFSLYCSKTMADVAWECEEGRNYIFIQSMLINVVSEELRKYFKQEWNKRYGAWDDTPVSGLQLFHAEKTRARPSKKKLQSKFQHGDTSQWDCTVLFDAIRFSNSISSSLTPAIKTALDSLRDIRNEKLGHIIKATFSDAEFKTIVNDIEDAFKTLSIPVHSLTQIRKKRNFYKSFQVLSPKPTHEVVYLTEKMNEIKQDLENLRTDNDGKLTYFYISGNPGSGKTQTARQLAEDVFRGVNWSTETAFIMTLNAKDADTLLNSYQNFGRRLNCNESVLANVINSSKPKQEKIKDLRSLITTRIKDWKRWWIIADNVEDLDIISPLLPQMGDEDWNNGQIILTTQNIKSVPSDSLLTKHISLSSGMNGDECRQLLAVLSGTDVDDPLLDEVAKQLDHQPLAMAAAAVYVKELATTKFSWRDYLQKLKDGKRCFTEEQLSKKNLAYSSKMSAAVFLAVQKSAEKSSILEQTFNLFSIISFEPLPIDIIVNYIQKLEKNCDKEEIYLEIKHCSLFLFEENEDHIDVRIHRVVHEAVTLFSENKRTELGKTSEPRVPNKGARVNFPGDVQNVVQALYCFKGKDDEKKMIPHFKVFDTKIKDLFVTKKPWYSLTSYFKKHEILKLLYYFANCLHKYCEYKLALELQKVNLQLYEESKDNLNLARILSEVCLLHIDLGEFDKAKGHGHRALDIRKTALGPTHAEVGESYDNLALVCRNMRELKQAKDYLQQALEIRMKALGPTHADVGASYNNLGIVYQEMGELEQAEDYYQQALEIGIKALGSTHVDFGTSYNNLGLLYQDMGELEKAKDYHQRALEIRTKALGPTHVDVGASNEILGLVCRKMGELEQAKDYHQQALEITMKALSPTHADVGASYNNLGFIHQDMGELEQAKDYHQRAVEIRTKALGPTHVDVGASYEILGLVCRKMCELEQAKVYHQQALEIRMKALSPTHVDVGASCNNLGLVYQDMGELEQAKDYQQRALEIRIKALGPTHSDVGASYYNLGLVYKDMGELEQAKNYHQRALEIRIKALGPTHADVGTSFNNLGHAYLAMGELEQAKDCFQRALETTIKSLSPNHADVGASYNNLGLVYHYMGELEQVKDYYQRALEITIKSLGPNHADVGTSYKKLGLVYQDIGALKQAKDFQQRALEIQIKSLGPTHVDVGASFYNLGLVYQDMGELEQAKDYYQRSLEIIIKALGPSHVNVIQTYNNLGLACLDMKELEQAKDYHQRALAIGIKTLGPTHFHVGTSYDNLGLVCRRMGELEQAEDYHQRALKIGIKALGPTHVDVGGSYNNLGLVYEMMGELEQAKDYYQRALEIRINALGPTDANVGDSCNNLGLVYEMMGELEQAKDYHQRALEIRIKALGPTHVDVGASYENLSLVCRNLGELETG